MPIIQIKNVPEAIFEELKAQAKKHHRSVSGEALNLIDKGLCRDTQEVALYSDIAMLRDSMRQKYGTAESSVKAIRKDRNR